MPASRPLPKTSPASLPNSRRQDAKKCSARRPTFLSSPATCSAPGAGLRSIAEPVLDTTGDFAELVLAMLGVAAKLERRRIAERTARGRADAKAKGVKFGRKPSLTPHQQQEARKRLAEGETQRSVARSYNVSQATISRLA
jgi:DNA invertase Pin-like site-specific DNA recombinase